MCVRGCKIAACKQMRRRRRGGGGVHVREGFQALGIVSSMSDDEGQLVRSHSQIFTHIIWALEWVCVWGGGGLLERGDEIEGRYDRDSRHLKKCYRVC